MRIALMADIHANREAFEACLGHARALLPDRFVLLGDYVGYGPDPVWTVDTIMELVAQGATAILGNHDHAVSEPRETMNSNASVAIAWTRTQLGKPERQFLAELPLSATDGSKRYIHSLGTPPRTWHYAHDAEDASNYLNDRSSEHAHLTFCGHVHVPAIFAQTATGKTTTTRPTAGVGIPYTSSSRWLAVVGSVGQPRDGISAAAYTMLDTVRQEITYWRVPYDVETTSRKVRNAGLPDALAERLLVGR